MALVGQAIINIRHHISANIIVNGFYTSSIRQLEQNWRQKMRLTRNPNKFGKLTNLPDYSFVDGKPAPFGIRQYTRIQKQREILKQVVKLVGEVDYAVEKHAQVEQELAQKRRMIIEGKLKPKGQCFLSQSSVKQSK